MTRALTALESLRKEPEALKHDLLARSIDPAVECAGLLRTWEDLRRGGSAISLAQPRLNPEEVWRAWKRADFSWSALSGIQLRTLLTSEETSLRPELITAMEKHPETLRRTLCLFGLAFSYFSNWRNMAEPERVERIISQAVKQSGRSNGVITCWKLNLSLFSKRAAVDAAMEVVKQRTETTALLNARFVPPTSNLGLAVASNVTELATAEFRRAERTLNTDQLLAWLKWMTDVVWKAPVPTASFYPSVSQVILSHSAEQSDYFSKALVDYLRFDSRLGDPRDASNRPKWMSVESAAAQRFLSWLARDNILFFFNTILPDSSQNRRRKDFWLRYKGAIRDFQVAASERDLWKIRTAVPERELPFFSKVDHRSTSAFLMRFTGHGGNYVVVEFSETNNAARIYGQKIFERDAVSFRSPRFFFLEHLKRPGHLQRILHVGDWESDAQRTLAGLGILP